MVLFNYLKKFKPEIDLPDDIGDTCLISAIRHENQKIVEQLMSMNADCELPNSFNETPLIVACSIKNPWFALKLLEKVKLKNTHLCQVAFSLACQNGLNNVVLEMLKQDLGKILLIIDPNNKTLNNRSPLMITTESGNLSMLRILLKNGVDPNFVENDKDNVTALIYAIQIVRFRLI